jgi:predicted ester cyclase
MVGTLFGELPYAANMIEPKTSITDYPRTLSGQPKTSELVGRYVSDERLAKHIADVEAAFPGYEIILEDLLAEGDNVVVRGNFNGIHRGPFAGIEPTGKSVSAGLIIIYAVANERIVDHWMQFDFFALLQQLQSASTVMAA